MLGPLVGFALMPGSFPLVGAAMGMMLPRRQEGSEFFSKFLRAPSTIGAVAPSSRELCRLMASCAELSSAQSVVEWGSGTGVITEALRERYVGHLFSIEIDPELASVTHERVPSARVFAASAQHTRHILDSAGMRGCDRLVSGLPWASFSIQDQEELFDVIDDVLLPGGIFVTFGYAHSLGVHGGRRLLAKMLTRMSDVRVSKTVWGNLPPAFVYSGRQGRPQASHPDGTRLFLSLHG